MARPKRGTPECEEATRKWRETVQEKYGGARNFMSRIGAIGGKSSGIDPATGMSTKGFAACRERAVSAGRKGGRAKSPLKGNHKKLAEELRDGTVQV